MAFCSRCGEPGITDATDTCPRCGQDFKAWREERAAMKEVEDLLKQADGKELGG